MFLIATAAICVYDLSASMGWLPQISTLQPLQLQGASKFVLNISSEQMGTYVSNKLQFT